MRRAGTRPLAYSDVFTHNKVIANATHNETLPQLLSKNMYSKLSNGYFLRGDDSLVVPRFNSRFMKDSLAYRGAVLFISVVKFNPA